MKNLIYESSVHTEGEAVCLRLYQVIDDFVLERRLVQADAMTLVQLFPISSRSELRKFAQADSYYTVLKPLYDEVVKHIEACYRSPYTGLRSGPMNGRLL
ncbi:hypothetical protein AB870_23580 (plasmid) [Pandoraea faecigallinarum]|uniref:Uncharacterized protein n=1 Tax=Pandoraea faecigallinarum TaxID=656179 RepID=A0A0H3WYH5_9BURK|nr:hypothetical protein [Pandoraea faecigallinarum]AKM33214.1 hypothetical protein AB870_23580 [Pandoraea faecigallinarum]